MGCFKKRGGGRVRKREEHRYKGSKMAMNKHLPIIALKLNRLNAPIKRNRIAEWIRKHDPHMYCLQETHLRTKDLHRLKVKEWEKNIPSKWTRKKKLG